MQSPRGPIELVAVDSGCSSTVITVHRLNHSTVQGGLLHVCVQECSTLVISGFHDL